MLYSLTNLIFSTDSRAPLQGASSSWVQVYCNCMCLYIVIHAYTHTYVRTYVRTYIHTCTYTYMHTHREFNVHQQNRILLLLLPWTTPDASAPFPTACIGRGCKCGWRSAFFANSTAAKLWYQRFLYSAWAGAAQVLPTLGLRGVFDGPRDVKCCKHVQSESIQPAGYCLFGLPANLLTTNDLGTGGGDG